MEKIENTSEKKSSTIITNKKEEKSNDSKINLLNKKIDELNDTLKNMKEEIDKKRKRRDFNVYDLLKSESGDGNVDIFKELVMALENKVFKKFGII